MLKWHQRVSRKYVASVCPSIYFKLRDIARFKLIDVKKNFFIFNINHKILLEILYIAHNIRFQYHLKSPGLGLLTYPTCASADNSQITICR